jgi:hypothetical protein
MTNPTTETTLKNPKPNSVGLINCLLQPGLLIDQSLKSMRVNINPLIKFCGIRTDPAAETESIGLQADAQLSWFLHATLTTLS